MLIGLLGTQIIENIFICKLSDSWNIANITITAIKDSRMTNGNDEQTAGKDNDVVSLPIRSPRKVSIAANAIGKSQDEEGATPAPAPKMDMANLFRRRSTFKGLAQSITNAITMRRFTKSSVDVPQKPKIKLENTYKLIPDSGKGFVPSQVHRVVTDVLNSNLEDVTYAAKTAGTLTENLTEMIKSRVKLLKFDRYKIICNVMLGQSSDQGMESASRCLWDDKSDNFCCVTYRNKSIIAIVTVYGVYFE